MNVDSAFPRIALPSATPTPTFQLLSKWPSVFGFGFLLLLIAASPTDGASATRNKLDPRLTAFLAEKRAQASDTFYSLVRKNWDLPKGETAPEINK